MMITTGSISPAASVFLILLGSSLAEAAGRAVSLQTVRSDPGTPEPADGDQLPAPARWGCQVLGTVAFPVLKPLSGGTYDRYAWARNRPLCFTLLTQTTMAIGGVVVESVGHPTTPPVFGAGSFDRFFRDALRSRSKHQNIFNDDVGGFLAPILASGSLLITASLAAGTEGYRESLTRALPLLWFGIGGNSLPTAVFKKSFGRERPFLKFNNQPAIRAFGVDDDARQSFYSGYASTAFFTAAFADLVMADLVRLNQPNYSLGSDSPWRLRLLRLGQAFALYGLATTVAYSRIEIDKYYMTDVLLAGFIGTLHVRLMYRWGYQAAEPRHALSVSGLPGGTGLTVSWSF